MKNRKASVFITVLLVLALCLPGQAFAADENYDHAAHQPDYTKTGSVAVDIVTAKGNTVAGGELTLYRAAGAVYKDGDNVFEFTEEFKDCGLSLNGIEEEESGAPSLAIKLAAYAEEKGLKGTAANVDGKGHTDFTDLPLGLYLIVQSEANEDYVPISPFLVTVPMWDGEKLVYDVEARPKPGTAIGKAKYDPPVEKLVTDKTNAPHDNDEFVFRITPTDPGYPMPNNTEADYDAETGSLTMRQKGPGSYEFGWMYFGPEHVGQAFTYKVYEVQGDDANYKYDTMIYLLTITVSQNEQEEILLDIKYTDPEGNDVGEVKFNNLYEPPEEPPELPDTGQLWWPVPVLIVCGLALFVFGFIKRRNNNES